MSENYRIGTSRGPAVFTRIQSLGSAKAETLSPHQTTKKAKKADVVVVEIEGNVQIKTGICATAILGKAQLDNYSHKIHWPKVTKGKINGHKEPFVVVKKGTELIPLSGLEAEEIISGNVPSGIEVEFIPPKFRKK